jgi:hypothetical protein
MENNDLRIIDLIHDITQLDYQVRFCGDFSNMFRIEYLHEYDGTFYEHEHRGFPGGTRNQLEKEIVKSLSTFLAKAREKIDEKV